MLRNSLALTANSRQQLTGTCQSHLHAIKRVFGSRCRLGSSAVIWIFGCRHRRSRHLASDSCCPSALSRSHWQALALLLQSKMCFCLWQQRRTFWEFDRLSERALCKFPPTESRSVWEPWSQWHRRIASSARLCLMFRRHRSQRKLVLGQPCHQAQACADQHRLPASRLKL